MCEGWQMVAIPVAAFVGMWMMYCIGKRDGRDEASEHKTAGGDPE